VGWGGGIQFAGHMKPDSAQGQQEGCLCANVCECVCVYVCLSKSSNTYVGGMALRVTSLKSSAEPL